MDRKNEVSRAHIYVRLYEKILRHFATFHKSLKSLTVHALFFATALLFLKKILLFPTTISLIF